jgi:nitrogen regulatory protein P-II 1
MKEIKAYIRPEMADRVLSTLEIAGVKGMTVIDVSTLGGWTDPQKTKLSIEYCEKYCCTVKIEMVCTDEEAEKYISIILEKAHTGQKGDGKIFVSDITESISIRTKEKGYKSL